ncbi:uncharacterized protein B0I36DRAFT_131638 [Microdochium trichocladiopsis]|uniref:Uncharacterized protein n=1 Tax=Microdochium trichocladiopsis TaxID=1682393 RepID=A0A9P8Y5E8_9PEZI|nr:uncharacterized protein B0I36DRAFT_131638 [Microdochium trichocladiopsis]KAH7029355.1 hypothetical protein B0I36DRAFT_131638 [Microdochium trichocladiopsis]
MPTWLTAEQTLGISGYAQAALCSAQAICLCGTALGATSTSPTREPSLVSAACPSGHTSTQPVALHYPVGLRHPPSFATRPVQLVVCSLTSIPASTARRASLRPRALALLARQPLLATPINLVVVTLPLLCAPTRHWFKLRAQPLSNTPSQTPAH